MSRVVSMTAAGALLLTSCTLGGAGAGILITVTEPGPFKEQPLPRAGMPPMPDVSPGDTVRIVMRTGAQLNGTYVRFDVPGAADPESYIVIRRDPPGSLPLERVPASDVKSVGVAVTDYTWIGVGAMLGLIVDVLILQAFTGVFEGLSS